VRWRANGESRKPPRVPATGAVRWIPVTWSYSRRLVGAGSQGFGVLAVGLANLWLLQGRGTVLAEQEVRLDYLIGYPEWEPFERVEPPRISWKRAKRAVAAAANHDEFVTISGWHSRSRWVYGSHNNGRRVDRLWSTTPHGVDSFGLPWYVAVLYPAPPDPVYEIDDLVGLVTWVGHVGCVWPGRDSTLMLPLVQALARHSRHFVVPVFFGKKPNRLAQPTVLLPYAEEVELLLDRLG
jgi:hypothetical protein